LRIGTALDTPRDLAETTGDEARPGLDYTGERIVRRGPSEALQREIVSEPAGRAASDARLPHFPPPSKSFKFGRMDVSEAIFTNLPYNARIEKFPKKAYDASLCPEGRPAFDSRRTTTDLG